MAFSGGNIVGGIFEALINIGILSVCFWLYGIRNYDANDLGSSLGIYIMAAILLYVAKGKVSTFTQVVFTIPALVLYVYSTILRPLKFLKIQARMKKRIFEEEMEEEQNAKSSYANWEHAYKAYRYGLPEAEPTSSEDPLMKDARALFDGYDSNKQVLKSRYRQLMKEHHPDRGGNERLCQCIIAVYEELNIKIV